MIADVIRFGKSSIKWEIKKLVILISSITTLLQCVTGLANLWTDYEVTTC